MAITREEVLHVARLARLNLSEDEVSYLALHVARMTMEADAVAV